MNTAGKKKKGKKIRASVLYNKRFTKVRLKKIYEDNIAPSHAVGRDGTSQKAFKANLDDEIDLILRKVEACSYKFTRYKQKLISKGAHKPPRILSIPTIRDRLTLRVLNDILAQIFEEARIWRPHIYIKSIKEVFKNPHDEMAFVRIDVKEFYPSIDHSILIGKVRSKVRKLQLIHLIEWAISTSTSSINTKGKGVPQGLSISNILSSVYLHKMDIKFKKKYQYFRYVDDILVICKNDDAQSIFNEIKKEIELLKLVCHELETHGKSQIRLVSEGIDYLGFHLTPTVFSVRDSSYARMIENLLTVFTAFKHVSTKKKNEEQLVWRLNLKITGCIYNGKRYGWVFFFSQIDNLSQLARLDDFITAQLKKRGLGHLRPTVRKFIRSYHEIRLNLRNTSYIPKFDELEIEDIIKELSRAEGHPEEHYKSKFDESEIRKKFTALINRQTRLLEQDLIEDIS